MSARKDQISVIGAGLMGHSIAQIFLAGGYHVALHDPNADILAEAADKILAIFTQLGQDTAYIENLSCHSDMASAVGQADFVIEAGPEKLPIKRDIFKQLSSLTKPETILATNTSAIPIHEIASVVEHPHRVVGTHFWNPPHLVRLVEVVQSELTTMVVIDRTISLLESVAMKSVHVKRDIPGFIGNRLQHAMKREAIALIAAGVCDAETIDTVVKNSFGARLVVLGPMEQSDLVGLNLTLDIYRTLFPTLDNTSEPPQLLVDKVSKGELGMKTGKGFRKWTTESAEQVRATMNEYLIKQAKADLKLP